MRILIHDYAGHAFPVSLSRELAARGHTVCHAFASALQTPRGSLERKADDPETLEFRPVEMGEHYVRDKYSFTKRRKHERAYGQRAGAFIHEWKPDVVLSGNTPTETQGFLVEASHLAGAKFCYWVQDFYSLAVTKLVRKKLPVLGEAIGWYYRRLDRSHLRASDAVISITEDFQTILDRWGIAAKKSHVVPNWAEIGAIPQRPKANVWAQAHGMENTFVFLYSGTLGMKHNPSLLTALAEKFQDDPQVRIVVNSEGIGAEFLQREKAAKGLSNLILNGYQRFEDLPDVMGSADVLLTILEPEAGVFSVPSKTLSYLCAGRPILGAMPPENLAARIVSERGAGRVVDPTKVEHFVVAAQELRNSQESLKSMGAAARRYAAETFDLSMIASRFEEIFTA